jgi:cytochrome c
MEAWITKFFNKNDHKLVGGFFILVVLFLGWDLAANQWFSDSNAVAGTKDSIPQEKLWSAPSDSELPKGEEGELIKYGRELVAHTAEYFGPNGSVAHYTNGLNCQNCHLNAGTQPWGNNYGSVAST